MKQLAKRILYAIAPRWTTAVLSARSRAHSHRIILDWGCDVLNRKLIERFGALVHEGPFAGMILSPMTFAEQLGPYLLGVYESELDEAWQIILEGRYRQIVDIGSKFGYYAVGLARSLPETQIIAFDTDSWARQATAEMAAANRVGNLRVEGFCDPSWLAANVDEAAFVLSDCEGYEDQLFAGPALARLRTTVLLIETHDGFVPGVRDRLVGRLQSTHEIMILGDPPRRRQSTCALDFLTVRELGLATQEVRPPQTWLLGLPRVGPNACLRSTRGTLSTRPDLVRAQSPLEPCPRIR
jgi:hypothetical protein